ncbi:tetratricopeptide repeat protein 37 [Selaginella moellendorffii]|uniref:tetratricopeptide repeat protein 37 n=1 Tax=Selaginella moellendorffii TaxID=88036 RepID=UPI000D1CC847|nr:tetratricopeptide repeat protein 37 [Selaginella moellendorffii]|eukprot:XP_024522889.1 tetratricopeptide repeat protein 37 [Selaginella moellendorffii]
MEEARQALGDGRFPDAVKLCKQLLKHDRRNYDGFVVLGLALVRSSQHLDQAEMSLKKAISLDPSALPAYQAMVELRESMGSSPDLLAESIQAALDVAMARNESALAADLMRKLARTFSAGHKHDQAKAAWGQVLDMEVSREQRVEALSGIVDAHIAAGKGAKECEATGEEETQAMVSHLEELVSMLPYVEIYRELLLALLACKARRAIESKSMYGHLVAIWKHLGDASLMYAQSLPFESADPQRSWQEAVDSWYSERVDAANNAVHAYRRAIHLLPSEGSLYRDLATAMEYMLNLKKPSRPSQTRWFETEIIVCCGLQHDGSNADMWVSLALVTQHKGLRQHALIQALRLDANHAIAWAYLGQLYLSLGEQVLAQQSFDRARSADPTLSLPWAGMALIHYNLSQRTASKDQA